MLQKISLKTVSAFAVTLMLQPLLPAQAQLGQSEWITPGSPSSPTGGVFKRSRHRIKPVQTAAPAGLGESEWIMPGSSDFSAAQQDPMQSSSGQSVPVTMSGQPLEAPANMDAAPEAPVQQPSLLSGGIEHNEDISIPQPAQMSNGAPQSAAVSQGMGSALHHLNLGDGNAQQQYGSQGCLMNSGSVRTTGVSGMNNMGMNNMGLNNSGMNNMGMSGMNSGMNNMGMSGMNSGMNNMGMSGMNSGMNNMGMSGMNSGMNNMGMSGAGTGTAFDGIGNAIAAAAAVGLIGSAAGGGIGNALKGMGFDNHFHTFGPGTGGVPYYADGSGGMTYSSGGTLGGLTGTVDRAVNSSLNNAINIGANRLVNKMFWH